jgi:hypothetical protein
MKVIKSKVYLVGVGGVREILQDKQKAIDFENGNQVEVTDDQLKTLTTLKWVEVQDGDENTNQNPEDGDITAVKSN